MNTCVHVIQSEHLSRSSISFICLTPQTGPSGTHQILSERTKVFGVFDLKISLAIVYISVFK